MTLALTWTESLAPASQIERYQVWRAEVAVDVQPLLDQFEMVFEVAVERDAFGAITNSSELYSYTDLTADPDNFFYFYFVKAIPVQGPSSRSAVTVPTGGSGLYGPVSIDADFVPAVDQSVDLVWNNPVGGATLEFRVKRSANGGGAVLLTTLGPSVFAYNDTDNVNRIANTYDYFVEAESTGGIVRTSNTKSFDLLTLPSAPVLTAAGAVEIDLDWTASTPDSELTIVNYRVERSDDGGAFAVLATVSGATLTYLDDDPTIDRTTTEYDYRVYAIDSVGQERVSNTVNLPIVSPQRVVFNSSQVWQVPAGVTEIDVLMVGGGGGTGRPIDGFEFGLPMAFAGGGGGGIVVLNGLAVTPLENLNIDVGAGGSSVFNAETNGGDSKVRRGGATIAGPAGGGGRGPSYTSVASGGNASNGSGGGGSYDWLGNAAYANGAGNGTGNAGGTGAGTATEIHGAGGGGGGAGAAGGNAVAGSGTTRGTPGNGGNGATPSASAIGGAWGTDIGESGVFGGGGPGSNYGDSSGLNWDIGTRGTGGGAANTGGGGVPSTSPTLNGIDGRSGIVVVYYLG